MPIYEYECSHCGHHCEKLQKLSDEPLRDCPECHEPSLQKLISLSAFQLKGTGWYVTDYANKGKQDTGGTETTSSNGSDKDTKKGKGDSKSDSGSSSSGGEGGSSNSEGGSSGNGSNTGSSNKNSESSTTTG